MRNTNPGTFWIILGYILLPFIALYKLITEPIKESKEGDKFFYYLLILCILYLIVSILDKLL